MMTDIIPSIESDAPTMIPTLPDPRPIIVQTASSQLYWRFELLLDIPAIDMIELALEPIVPPFQLEVGIDWKIPIRRVLMISDVAIDIKNAVPQVKPLIANIMALIAMAAIIATLANNPLNIAFDKLRRSTSFTRPPDDD